MKKIAIFITSYNSAKYIGKTVDSLKSQTSGLDKIKGLYLFDDCSTDSTIAVVKNRWDLTVPLYIISQPYNRGEAENWNIAMRYLSPRVTWAIRIHADNPVKSHWLKKMWQAIESCPDRVGSISSSYDYIRDTLIKVGENSASESMRIISGTVESVRDTLYRGCWWHNSAAAINMQAFRDIGEFSTSLKQAIDMEWLLRCLYKKWSIAYIPCSLFYYIEHKDMVSRNNLLKDYDIRERALLIRQYKEILSARDIFILHGRHIIWLIRRIARAIQCLDFNLLSEKIKTGCIVLYNVYYVLLDKKRLKNVHGC